MAVTASRPSSPNPGTRRVASLGQERSQQRSTPTFVTTDSGRVTAASKEDLEKQNRNLAKDQSSREQAPVASPGRLDPFISDWAFQGEINLLTQSRARSDQAKIYSDVQLIDKELVLDRLRAMRQMQGLEDIAGIKSPYMDLERFVGLKGADDDVMIGIFRHELRYLDDYICQRLLEEKTNIGIEDLIERTSDFDAQSRTEILLDYVTTEFLLMRFKEQIQKALDGIEGLTDNRELTRDILALSELVVSCPTLQHRNLNSFFKAAAVGLSREEGRVNMRKAKEIMAACRDIMNSYTRRLLSPQDAYARSSK